MKTFTEPFRNTNEYKKKSVVGGKSDRYAEIKIKNEDMMELLHTDSLFGK